MRIFDRQDFLRVNRARARIKVLIDKIGIDAFRELVEEELEGDWVAERDFSLDEILFEHDEEANAPGAAAGLRHRPTATGASSTASCESNVAPQRQARLQRPSRSRSAAAT